MIAVVSEGEVDSEYYGSGEDILHSKELREGEEMNIITSTIDEILDITEKPNQLSGDLNRNLSKITTSRDQKRK